MTTTSWGGTGATYYATTTKIDNLTPHTANTRIVMTGSIPCKVKVTPLALEKMNNYIQLCPKEIGWLGIVSEHPTEYVIEDVILFKQEVTATTTEIDENSLAEIVNDILINDPVNGVAIANSLRMWGHSHVNMEVNPSGQDDSQMNVFNTGGMDYFIRAIGNKAGKLRFDIYHYNKGIAFMDVEWGIFNPINTSLRSEIKTEIEAKVKERVYSYTGATGGDFDYTKWLGSNRRYDGMHQNFQTTSGMNSTTNSTAANTPDSAYYIKQLEDQRNARRRLIQMANEGAIGKYKEEDDEYVYPAQY